MKDSGEAKRSFVFLNFTINPYIIRKFGNNCDRKNFHTADSSATTILLNLYDRPFERR